MSGILNLRIERAEDGSLTARASDAWGWSWSGALGVAEVEGRRGWSGTLALGETPSTVRLPDETADRRRV